MSTVPMTTVTMTTVPMTTVPKQESNNTYNGAHRPRESSKFLINPSWFEKRSRISCFSAVNKLYSPEYSRGSEQWKDVDILALSRHLMRFWEFYPVVPAGRNFRNEAGTPQLWKPPSFYSYLQETCSDWKFKINNASKQPTQDIISVELSLYNFWDNL